MRRAEIIINVEECGDDCPFYRDNDCADNGHNRWCEASDHIDLDVHFAPQSYPFSRIVIPDFPSKCPLKEV